MDFGKHLGKLGKIFKLSDGKLMTVLPPDENHFLNQLKEKGLKATLMLDSTTNFDEVKNHTKSISLPQEKEETTQKVDLTKDQKVKTDLPPINSYKYNNKEYVKVKTPKENKQYFVLKNVAEELGYTFEDIDGQFENIPTIKNRDDFNKILNTSYLEATKDNELLFDKYEEDFDIKLEPSEQIEDEIAPDLLLKDYVLGDGFDFSIQTPDEILTYENAADWFNYRSELANYPFTKETVQESTIYSVLPGENEITPEGAYLKSGYLSKEIFGTIDTWDEKTHLRNKEVKEKIFAGTHGYNPATDTLYKLSKPVKVDEASKLYAFHNQTEFEDYDNFVKKINERTIDLPLVDINLDIYSGIDLDTNVLTLDPRDVVKRLESEGGVLRTFDMELFHLNPYYAIDLVSTQLMEAGFYIERSGVASKSADIYSSQYHDFFLEQELKRIDEKINELGPKPTFSSEGFSVRNATTESQFKEILDAYNNKLELLLEQKESAFDRTKSLATVKIQFENTTPRDAINEAKKFNDFLNKAGQYHDPELDTLTENYLEFAKDGVEKEDIAESQKRITGAYDFIELVRKDLLNLRKKFPLPSSIEKIDNIYTDAEILEYIESNDSILNSKNFQEGSGEFGDIQWMIDKAQEPQKSELIKKQQENILRRSTFSNLFESGILEDYDNRDEELLYLKYGSSYDENKALQILAQMYPDGFPIDSTKLIKIDDNLSQPDRKAIIDTDKFKNLVKSLYETEGYLEDKKSEIDKQMRSDKYFELLKYALNEESTKLSAALFEEGDLALELRKDINLQLENLGKRQAEVIFEADQIQKQLSQLHVNLNDLEKEIDSFLKGFVGETNKIMEKYNIDPESPGAMDMLKKNEFAVDEYNRLFKTINYLNNQKELLETETIPTHERLKEEIMQEYSTILKTEDEYNLAKNIANRQHAAGTYYLKTFGISVFDIFYGSVAAISSAGSRTLIELGGFEKGSIGYSLLTDIAEFGDWLGDDVDKKVQRWNNSLSLPTRWEDVDDAGSAIDYLFTGFTQNVPYVLMMIGSGGIGGIRGATGLMGTIAYSDDFDQKYKMNELWIESGGMYGQEFSFFEMFSSALVSGAAETFFERVSFGQLKGLGYFGKTGPKSLDNAKKAMDKSIRKTCKIDVTEGGRLDLLGKALNYPKSFLDEGFSEFMTEFSNNLMDVMIGVEGANLTAGLDEAFINGAFLSSMLHSPSMFKTTLLDAFIDPDTNKMLAQQSEKVQELLIKLNDTSMSKEQKSKIEGEIEQIGLDINKALSKDLFKVDLMTKEQKRELLDIHQKDIEARRRVKEITSDKSLTSEQKAEKLMAITNGINKRAVEKNKLLAAVDPKKAEEQYQKAMNYHNDLVAMSLGKIKVDIIETNTDEQFVEAGMDNLDKIVEEASKSENAIVSLNEDINTSKENINNAKTEIENIKIDSKNKTKDVNNDIIEIETDSNNKINDKNKEINEVLNKENLSTKQKESAVNRLKNNIKDLIKEKVDKIKAKKLEKEKIREDRQKNIEEQNNIIDKEKKNKRDAEDALALNGSLETNVRIGGNILNTNAYGKMVPIYDGKTGEIVKLKVVINKQKAIKDGAWTTVAHEFTHALFANTLKSDSNMREVLGESMAEMLSKGNLKFKDKTAESLFFARVAGYDANKQGEEALAIAAEMLVKGDLTIKEGILSKLGNMFRRWSMNRYGYDYKFDSTKDIENFLKDYSYSIKKHKPTKALANLLEKGAEGKMFKDAKTPKDKRDLQMYYRSSVEFMKNNSKLVESYDVHTKNEDGSRKYKDKKDFQTRGQADITAVYMKILESGKNSLDKKILEEQGDFDPKGLPREAQQDYIRKVKEYLQERWLKNFDPSKNESAAGYLFGKNGVLYYAKRDVQKDYVQKEGGTDKRSIDRQTSDGQSYADVIAAEKDSTVDRIENADLSKQETKELKNTVDDLIMVIEMLDLPNNVKTAIKQTIATTSIPLDGLTYKGVRELLISTEGKATTEKNVIPTGALFEVLNNISAEFGIDPLRILAKQDLNAEQRKAAQEYIFTKSVNQDGSFNPRFLDALPEGQDRDGRATGVANTKLGQFYAKGKRLKVGEGAKKKLGQKFAQNKRTDITKEEFLNLFGINVDGTFQPGTKADGAIRELVVQMSQLAANQEMRLNAIENRLESANVIAKLKDGVSEAMYSKVFDQNIADEFGELSKSPEDKFERVRGFYQDVEGRDKGINPKKPIKLIDPTAISKYAKDRDGKLLNITQQQHLNSTIAKFLLKFPQHFETIINTVTSSIDRTLYGTKENFINEVTKDLSKKEKVKFLENIKKVEQKYKKRNNYTYKKFQTKDTVKKIKEDLKNDRAENILDYARDVQDYLKDNPNDFVVFNEIRRDNNSNQSGGYGRNQINALFYIKEKNSDKADEKIKVVEEHASPQADVMTQINNAARKGILDKLEPIFKAKLVQGSIAYDVDVIVNNSYKFKQALDFNEIIAQKILKDKLTVKDSRLTPLIRYIVPQKTKDGKPYYVDINNMVWAPTGKTWAQEFGVDIKDKNIEITQSVIEAQNKLAREVIIGNITPQQAKDKLNDIPLKSLSELDIQRPTKVTRNKLIALVNSIVYSKPIKVKGMSTFDFDDTLARTSSGVLYTMPDGTTGRLTAEEFASDGDNLLEDGAKFDFSEFNDVVDGKPGPLLQKARNRAKKFGTKDMFVLTARPQASAKAIQQFLKSQGLDIPLENITGLGDSTGDAKAQWMLDKVDKGYNDMYFVDDAFQNVEAVKVVLDQLDIKSKVVQAKLKENGKIVELGDDTMYSKVVKDDATSETKDINTEYNDIIERKKKLESVKRFSSAEARKRGAKIGKFRFYIPPSAEDFKGLIYYFLGRGKQGDADMRFFEKTLFKPFATGIRAWNTYKQNMVNEYKALQKQFPKIKRTKKVPDTSFTVDTAIRVYLWDKAGFEIPGISKTLQKKLVAYVNQNANVKGFAEGLSVLSRRGEGYIEPSNNWMMESISFDLRDIVERVGRQEFLAEFMENRDIIFSPENLNKIEAAYGTSFRDALENILFRMENGTNRTFGQDKVTNRFTEWINGSVGAIMFFNTRSVLLQTMSTVNFINWSDNNIFKASAAFANQKQFWKDFAMIFNSPQLKQRRAGLQTDVSASELTQTFKDNGYSPRTVINYLLQKGFLPTQIADSFAIAFGGASFYRNRYNGYIKKGMSAQKANEQAMLDMQEIAEATQQSSREDLISQQQAGPLGRIILAFQNITMQYGRETKKAALDIANNRGDMKTNVSKLIYYGAVQNIVFLSLQSALAFALFGDDDELIEDKTARVGNGVLDSFLRGTGIYGAIVSTIKNTVIQWDAQSKKGYGQQDISKIALELVNLSPPIGSKIRKIISAFKTEQYNKGVSDELGLRVENPTIKKWASIIEAATNIPLARLLNKANNIEEAITGQHATLERLALLLGWNTWDLGIKDEELEEAKDAAAEKRAEQKKKEKEQEKKEKEKAKEEEKKKEEEEKKEKGIKTVRCSGIRSNGERCNITTETAEEKFLCVHHMEFKDGMDRDGDGIKEYRCTAIKANGKRCNNKTENKNKKCYAHQ